jgi:hypothetical protein
MHAETGTTNYAIRRSPVLLGLVPKAKEESCPIVWWKWVRVVICAPGGARSWGSTKLNSIVRWLGLLGWETPILI